MNLRIRPATESDAPSMASIFFHTIRHVNIKDYSPMQIDAWAGPTPDPEKWKARLVGKHMFVVCHAHDVVGFAELEPDGHVDAVYVHHEYQKCGVGSLLLTRIEELAVQLGLRRLFTEASITALPFFRHRGFEVIQQQEVEYRGSTFTNFRMEYTMPDA